MNAQGAQVIDLDEYRRRRAVRSDRPAAAPAAVPVLWVPVWMWVPLHAWPFR